MLRPDPFLLRADKDIIEERMSAKALGLPKFDRMMERWQRTYASTLRRRKEQDTNSLWEILKEIETIKEQ